MQGFGEELLGDLKDKYSDGEETLTNSGVVQLQA